MINISRSFREQKIPDDLMNEDEHDHRSTLVTILRDSIGYARTMRVSILSLSRNQRKIWGINLAGR